MSDTTRRTEKKTAGAFDVRNIIGALLGVYGVILVLMGIFADSEPDKTGEVNSNLWAGLVLLVVGAVFIAWWKLRPIRVPEEEGGSGVEAPER